MALVHSVTTDESTYPQAYSRITSFRGDKDYVHLYVCTYADEAARQREDFPIRAIEYATPLNSLQAAFYTNAYAFLRAHSDFAGSVNHPDPLEPAE